MPQDQRLYGFDRTTCTCEACQEKCEFVSGMVSPPDLLRWQRALKDGFDDWAMDNLAASPGAKVLQNRQVRRIHTIVMARREDTGACVMFLPSRRCGIHEDAPYGCSHFDCTMDLHEGNRRSYAVLVDIDLDWATNGPYSQLWTQLQALGKAVEAPEVARQRLRHP